MFSSQVKCTYVRYCNVLKRTNMWLKRTNIQLICSLIKQKRTDKRTNMQNIRFKKPKRPVDEQIFGIRGMKWVCMWLKRTNILILDSSYKQ